MGQFLRTNKTGIVDRRGQSLILKGVNAGGWLMMEAYFLYAPALPEQHYKKIFKKALGEHALKDFEHEYRSHFFYESDVARMAKRGFNCLRVPFHYKIVEKSPYQWDYENLKFLDKVVAWGKKYKIWVILDLHAAPGSQNHDWHSDSSGAADFWKNKSNQNRVYALWEFLANRYKDAQYLAGYDLLNEAVLPDTAQLNEFYNNTIKAIRRADKNHIVFIEGNRWAIELDCLEKFEDDNYVLSAHTYEPNDFTFNFVPHLHYPGVKANGKIYNRNAIRQHLLQYKKIADERQVPILVGEFGVNYRQGLYNEQGWVKDNLDCFKEFGFHWTYWTYKAIKNNINPDGLYSYVKNPPWVNRLGPLTGWGTYHKQWPKHKREMIESWHTKEFEENTVILKLLQRYV